MSLLSSDPWPNITPSFNRVYCQDSGAPGHKAALCQEFPGPPKPGWVSLLPPPPTPLCGWHPQPPSAHCSSIDPVHPLGHRHQARFPGEQKASPCCNSRASWSGQGTNTQIDEQRRWWGQGEEWSFVLLGRWWRD